MKKALALCVAAAIYAQAMISCGPEERPETGPVVARVNDYSLCLDEFQELLAQEMRLEDGYKLTQEAQRQFLEDLVTRQVLIQEAKRLKLDAEEKFVRSVQRFWESALIRDLMDRKAREIEERTLVTQEEVLALYRKLKEADPGIPDFEIMRSDLFDRVMEEKKTRLLAQWIEGLEKKCSVQIEDKALSGPNEAVSGKHEEVSGKHEAGTGK